jgi:hypothetical protein
MKHITTIALLCLASCTTIQPSIEPYLSPQVEKSYDSMQVAASPVDPELLKGEPLAPIANAGKDDTLYFPERTFKNTGRCTNAATRQWAVLRTSLPSSGKDTMTVDIYKIYIDFRFTCRASNGQTAFDDKRITLIWQPKDVLATLDAGKMGTWAITNDGTPAVVFKSGN